MTPLTTTVTFRNLGAGYVSLGTASLLSDRREIEARTVFRRGRVQASVDVSRQHDNLADQKLFTTERDRLGASLSTRLTANWTSSLRLQRATLHNDASDPERWIAYGSWLAGTRQSVSFGRRSLARTVSVDYNYRTTGDDNPARVRSTSTSHTVNARVVLAPARIVSITPTAGLVQSRFGEDPSSLRSNFGLGGQLNLLRGKWVSSLNLGRSHVHQTTVSQASLSSRYQVTGQDAVILSMRLSDNENVAAAERSFRESTLSLRWTRRF
ncbi:MAG: hypothetical protein U5R14_14905 [Gemmatimonadota bacterium]|nr:hypothetical protein [Gemmatimonadota bacterium]